MAPFSFRVWTFVVVSLLLSFAICLVGLSDAEPNQEGSLPVVDVESYLYREGERLDCYFTLELDHEAELEGRGLGSLSMPLIPTTNDVAGLVSLLRKKWPNVLIFQSSSNPRIIHIEGASLAKSSDYVMEKEIDFSFSGFLQDVPNALGQKLGGRITEPRVYYSFQGSGDWATTIKLDARNRKVRDILTDAVPLKNYSRILWRSQTLTYDGKLQTWVQFYGQRTTPSESHSKKLPGSAIDN
jgi:hypothetical protein